MRKRIRAGSLNYEAAAIYEYPEHLRPWVNELPRYPGVYIFHGESESLPLYIGKSINIRSRVMSHLRTPDEAEMLRQTRRITFTRTAGEIGALLLEAQLIKEQQPLFNKRLRRNRQLCSLQLKEGRPQIVYAHDVNFAVQPGLYGLFANRRTALQMLHDIADEQRLCLGLLGLENLSRGRACFRAALRRCAGACCGGESEIKHQSRLLQALEKMRIVCWPWQGPVGLRESSGEMTQYHIIHNWFWLGSVERLPDVFPMTQPPRGFDSDGYKILCKPLLRGDIDIMELNNLLEP